MPEELTHREVATVLYALRMLQNQIKAQGAPESMHFADVPALSIEEINELCKKLILS